MINQSYNLTIHMHYCEPSRTAEQKVQGVPQQNNTNKKVRIKQKP